MKIVHLADSHLGFSAYSRVDKWGRNLREETVYQGFNRAIEDIIKIRPDAVVHAGDIFHHVRPRIRPLLVFKQALEKLCQAGIPVIIISGNHDAPKSFASASPFALYEGMDGVHIAHHYEYEVFEVDGYHFHCIPFCLGQESYLEEFRKLEEFRRSYSSGNDVLVMHGLVEALWHKRLRTVGEHQLRDSFLKSDFSYIALGHFHGQAQLSKNAWYSGSIEYFRFGEARDEKGMLLVDLDRGEVTKIPVEVTGMLDPPPLDCDGLSSQELTRELQGHCQDLDVENNVVRIRLRHVSREAYRNLNQSVVNQLREKALHLEVLPEFKDETCDWDADPMDVGQLPQEFKKFLEEDAYKDIPKAIRDEVISYGTALIKRTAEARVTEAFDAPK